MNRDVENLKVVKILDAMFCVRCNHAYVADVLLTDGSRKKMFYCARRDCDNWRLEPQSGPAPDMEQPLFDGTEAIGEGWDPD